MKKCFILIIVSIIIFSCNEKSKELELRERELEIKERELKLLEEKNAIQNAEVNIVEEIPTIEMYEPKEQVIAFLNEIGNKEFNKAFQRQNNKYWKPYDKFISTKQGYGGTSNVEIYDSYLVDQTNSYAKVFVNYFAADPYNKDGLYRQYFELSNESGNWLIINAFLEKNTNKRNVYAHGNSSVDFFYEGGIIKVPALINNTVKVYFVLDSGASDVSISLDYASVLIKSGTLNKYDYIGQEKYQLADGSIINAYKVILREISIGNFTLYNIVASINENMDAPLLLGQSFLQKFGSVKIDYNNEQIHFENN